MNKPAKLTFQPPGVLQQKPLTVEQACTYRWAALHLGVSMATMTRMVRAGLLKKHKPEMTLGERVSLLSIDEVRELRAARDRAAHG